MSEARRKILREVRAAMLDAILSLTKATNNPYTAEELQACIDKPALDHIAETTTHTICGIVILNSNSVTGLANRCSENEEGDDV